MLNPENREVVWARLVRLHERIEKDTDTLYELVIDARGRPDALTWEEIGEALGVSRQTAWERFTLARRKPGVAKVHPDQGKIC